MLGTSGTVVATGGSGSLASGYTLYSQGSSNNFTLSKVARTDGVQGEWQQIVMNSGNVDGFKLQQNFFSGSWTAGDTIRVSVEFQTSNDWVSQSDFRLVVTSTGLQLAYFTSAPLPAGQPPSSGVMSVVGVVPASAPNVQIQVLFKASQGTIRIGRIGAQNLTAQSLTAYAGL